jgi:chromosome segregation ATPase
MGIGDRSAIAPVPAAPKAAPPPDPALTLTNLQKTLETNNATIDTLTQQNNNLRTDMAGLQKAVSDIKQLTQAYTQAYPGIAKTVQDLTAYQATKAKLIDGALSQADKDGIQQKVAAYKKSIDDQNTQLEANQKARDDAATKLQNAQTALTGAQAAYDGVRGALKSLQDQGKEMNATQEAINKEEEAQHLKNTSFLVSELKTQLDVFKPTAVDQYQSQLQQALADTNTATQGVRDAKTASDASQVAVDATQKTLNDLINSRRDSLLKTLETAAQAAKA